MHWALLHGLHCIQSGSIVPQCMEFSSFNDAAWNPLHSIGMLWAKLHKTHCIQSRCMESTAFNMDEFYHAAFSTLYSITIHGIHCIQSGCFGPCCIKSTAFNRDALGLAAWTPLHTIRIHCATMHGILAFIDAACNPLYSIGMLWAMLHKTHCIQSCFMESTALNHVA